MNGFRADRLRELREKQGLSRKVLSELLGFGHDTVRKYESGEREPDFKHLSAIARFFGVPIAYFWEDSPEWGNTDEEL